MLRFKRGEIYSPSDGMGNPFLILTEGGFNTSICFIKKANVWDCLPETKINNVGNAAINCISTYKQNWFVKQEPVKIGQVSNRKIRDIVRCISDFYLGYIKYIPELHSYAYTDEEIVVVKHDESHNESSEEQEQPDQHSDQDKLSEALQTVYEDDIEEEKETSSSILETHFGFPNLYDLSVDDERYNNSSTGGGRKRNSNSTAISSSRDNYKKLFTEDEMLVIATSPIGEVMKLFDVNRSYAELLHRNATKIIGRDRSSHTKGVCDDFENGLSIEEVSSKWKLPIYVARYRYKVWLVNSQKTSSLDSAREEMNKKSEEQIFEICSKKISDIAEIFKIGISDACRLRYDFRQKLFKNPYILCGFGKNSFNMKDYIEEIQKTGEATIGNIVAIEVFNKVKQLEPLYKKYYESHYDIVSGLIEIPEDILPVKEEYLRLISKRYRSYTYMKNVFECDFKDKIDQLVFYFDADIKHRNTYSKKENK